MTTTIDLLKQGRRDEIWQKYCGFVDLTLPEFMEIQRELLMEQIGLLGACELGQKLLNGRVPASVEEFRQNVPLTTYEAYLPYLPEKREDVLPAKPHVWAKTSGRTGTYEAKWAPYSHALYKQSSGYIFATFIFAASDQRGIFAFEPNDAVLAAIAPPPYVTGAVVAPGMLEHFPLNYLPPLEQAEKMGFQTRIAEGMNLALKDGIDIFFGLSGVLVRVGELFEQGSGKRDPKLFMQPKVLARLVKGLIKSKLAGRPLLPKDLWTIKAITGGGTDTELFREKIKYYWGKYPIETYGASEMGLAACQTWGTDMTFVPDVDFLEFIPEEERLKNLTDPNYTPQTVLYDEVEVDNIYEVVITNFHGGVFTRYRMGDLIKIVAQRDEKYQINLPQMVFYSRVGDVLDLEAFTRLTEKSIGRALEQAQVGYVDWAAAKAYHQDRAVLHLHFEPRTDEFRSEAELATAVHEALQQVEPEYGHWASMMGGRPPLITRLSAGTFERYLLEKQAAGAEPAHLKPARMNPTDKIIDDMIRLSNQK